MYQAPGLENKDLWGRALIDYHRGATEEPLILHSSFGEPEAVPVDVFFRSSAVFSDMETYAMELADGSILDVGAGTGCHSLFLQAQGKRVTALEKSPGACSVMRAAGVERVVEGDIHSFQGSGFDTVLLMMNGLGLAGTLDQLAGFLKQVFNSLSAGGQVLADSCDIHYLYSELKLPETPYYGEQQYFYEYKGQRDPSFHWLFVDVISLRKAAAKANLSVQVVYEEQDQYLVRIVRS